MKLSLARDKVGLIDFNEDDLVRITFNLLTFHFSLFTFHKRKNTSTCVSRYIPYRVLILGRWSSGRVNGELMEMRRAQEQAHKRKSNLR